MYVCVVIIAVSHDVIRTAVMSGQRPDVNAVTGPDALVKHIKDCIERCWDQLPDIRPSFTGRYATISFVAALTYIFRSVTNSISA